MKLQHLASFFSFLVLIAPSVQAQQMIEVGNKAPESVKVFVAEDSSNEVLILAGTDSQIQKDVHDGIDSHLGGSCHSLCLFGEVNSGLDTNLISAGGTIGLSVADVLDVGAYAEGYFFFAASGHSTGVVARFAPVKIGSNRIYVGGRLFSEHLTTVHETVNLTKMREYDIGFKRANEQLDGFSYLEIGYAPKNPEMQNYSDLRDVEQIFLRIGLRLALSPIAHGPATR